MAEELARPQANPQQEVTHNPSNEEIPVTSTLFALIVCTALVLCILAAYARQIDNRLRDVEVWRDGIRSRVALIDAAREVRK